MSKRTQDIFDWMSVRVGKEYRAVEIGRGVGLKKTPYLLNMLHWLVDNGWVERRLGDWGGFACYYYFVTAIQVDTFKMKLWNESVSNGEQ